MDTYGGVEMIVPEAQKDLTKKDARFKPTDLHPELRRQMAVEEFMRVSGDFVDTSAKFKVHKAVNLGLLKIGYDRSDMEHIFNQYAWQTADNGRRRETNVVQLLMPPQINVIPNAGTLGEKEEDKISTVQRVIGWITGRGKGEEK